MKKIILYIMVGLVGVLFSGCAELTNEVKVYENKISGNKKAYARVYYSNTKEIDGISMTTLTPGEEFIAKFSLRVRMVLKAVAEETIKQGYTNFVIYEGDMDQRTGMFPFTTFNEVKEYCFNLNYSSGQVGTEKKCIPLLENKDNFFSITYEMLNNPDYRITSFNAKEILEELNSYKISKEDLARKYSVGETK